MKKGNGNNMYIKNRELRFPAKKGNGDIIFENLEYYNPNEQRAILGEEFERRFIYEEGFKEKWMVYNRNWYEKHKKGE